MNSKIDIFQGNMNISIVVFLVKYKCRDFYSGSPLMTKNGEKSPKKTLSATLHIKPPEFILPHKVIKA